MVEMGENNDFLQKSGLKTPKGLTNTRPPLPSSKVGRTGKESNLEGGLAKSILGICPFIIAITIGIINITITSQTDGCVTELLAFYRTGNSRRPALSQTSKMV